MFYMHLDIMGETSLALPKPMEIFDLNEICQVYHVISFLSIRARFALENTQSNGAPRIAAIIVKDGNLIFLI